MDFVSRLILVVLAIVMGWSTPVGAIGLTPSNGTTPETQYACTVQSNGSGYGSWFPSESAACTDAANRAKPATTYAYCAGKDGGVAVQTTITWNGRISGSNFGESFNRTTTRESCPGGAAGSTTTDQNAYSGGFKTQVVNIASCPVNSTKLSSGNCQCNKDYKTANPDGTGGCVLYACVLKPLQNDTVTGPYDKPPVAGAGASVQRYCDTARTAYADNPDYGCEIGSSIYSYSRGPDGKYWARAVSGYTSNSCMDGPGVGPNGAGVSAADAAASGAPSIAAGGSAPPSTSSCAKGTCPGTVNGQSICVACSFDVSVDNRVAQAPSGAGSAPGSTYGSGTQSGIGLPNGSTTTEIACAGNSCTAKSTTYDQNGIVVGIITQSTTKTAICAKDPSSSVCSGSSGTGSGSGGGGSGSGDGSTLTGACAAVSCSGDAIQCAIAKDQLKRNCEALDAAPSTDPAVMAAAAGVQPADHPYKNGTSSAIVFDQTDIVAGGCPADQSFSVGGDRFAPVVIPFSKLCGPAGWLGNILVGITALACLGIVFVRGS